MAKLENLIIFLEISFFILNKRIIKCIFVEIDVILVYLIKLIIIIC